MSHPHPGLLGLMALCFLALLAPAGAAGNLLRNGDFQDDWLTQLPELKNHHWNYSTEVYNRRDYNPDGWLCAGNWEWQNADAPRGERQLVLRNGATLTQSVNWVTVHNPARPSGWPDGGGYPTAEARKVTNPARLVRDLSFRVLLDGANVPENAGAITVSFDGKASASAPIPAGDYAGKWAIVSLPAAAWLEKVTDGTLPMTASVTVKYAGAGEVVIRQAVLLAADTDAPNLLANGGFEALDRTGYPAGWNQPQKYYYFAPGIYYNFNTWHNSTSPNRGPVAADQLVTHDGHASLRMIMATGDEKSVSSTPIALNQQEARLIEAQVWVKTDQMAMMQLDALDEQGRRLQCYNFIQKQIVSIGTDDWRLVRQVFAPTQPVKTLTLQLCARGMNGYTLDDTGEQPQQNAVGTIWWDDAQVFEPESTVQELAARGVAIPKAAAVTARVCVQRLDLGDRMLGANAVTAEIVAAAGSTYRLRWEFTAPSGKTTAVESAPVTVPRSGRAEVRVPYTLAEPCAAYTEYRGKLALIGQNAPPAQELWFATWSAPIDLELGSLYVLPERPLFVRANLGVTAQELRRARTLRLEVVRRATGKVELTQEVPASPADLAARRAKIPNGMRDDFRNLVLADMNVAALPLQPFNAPERNWFVRATLLAADGAVLARTDSHPFCRLAHDAKQLPVQTVKMTPQGVLVNGQPWMPWGVVYGHNPVYDGPADNGAYHDLRNLKDWGMYDRHGGTLGKRSLYDGNCMRYIAGITDLKTITGLWENDNLYASSAYLGHPAWSMDEFAKQHGGMEKFMAYLQAMKTAPMVVSTALGVEEAFSHFVGATPEQLAAYKDAADKVRAATGKPVMVGHGGYWNRFEFEKVPFFDIYDPETEPFYPANIHTDMRPLIAGQPKTMWLRPQMYESVPYERWRFHVFVEMMRGCTGWQVAHGPGDPTTYRGLHGEVEFMKTILYSTTPAPNVTIAPWVEHMVRRYNNKTYVVAATTHGMNFGTWRWDDAAACPAGKARVTEQDHAWRDESNGYSVSSPPVVGPRVQGLQSLPNCRIWPAGSKLVQWVRVEPGTDGFALLVKADGRWTHAASWGKIDLAKYRADNDRAHWFIRTFYRAASGFIGWGSKVPPSCLPLVPNSAANMGALPAAGAWVKLEVPLDQLGVTGQMLIDGVGSLHETGRICWGPTTIVAPDGAEQVVFGDDEDRPAPQLLKSVKISVPGLRAGAKVKVVFEDREITAVDGGFVDDFTGVDLYQRFGGLHTGYGASPVALHIYEIP